MYIASSAGVILENNDARLILHREFNEDNDMIESKLRAKKLQPWTANSKLLGPVSTVVATNEVLTHKMQMVMPSDETQIQIFAHWPML